MGTPFDVVSLRGFILGGSHYRVLCGYNCKADSTIIGRGI